LHIAEFVEFKSIHILSLLELKSYLIHIMDMNIADNVYYKNLHNDAIDDSIDDSINDNINDRIDDRISDPIDNDKSTTVAAKANELAVAQHEVKL
jgi:hypothetical protein